MPSPIKSNISVMAGHDEVAHLRGQAPEEGRRPNTERRGTQLKVEFAQFVTRKGGVRDPTINGQIAGACN